MKLIQFPEGIMSELDWVLQHADRVEPYKRSWQDLYKRDRYNALNHDEQEAYMHFLRKQADKQLYRAWKGEAFYPVSEKTYKLWLGENLLKTLQNMASQET